MRRRLLILLAVAAMCLAPGCSVLKPYNGIKFPAGTECRPYQMIPQGLVVMCLVPMRDRSDGMPRLDEGSLDAA